jgi:hypothetical protein
MDGAISIGGLMELQRVYSGQMSLKLSAAWDKKGSVEDGSESQQRFFVIESFSPGF